MVETDGRAAPETRHSARAAGNRSPPARSEKDLSTTTSTAAACQRTWPPSSAGFSTGAPTLGASARGSFRWWVDRTSAVADAATIADKVAVRASTRERGARAGAEESFESEGGGPGFTLAAN